MAVVELERTFALVKPDAVAADNADEILHIAELKGFKVLARQRLRLTRDRAEAFYGEHKGRPFFEGLVAFMTSGPVEAVVLSRENAVAEWRALMGPTNTQRARADAPQSLRALYGTDGTRNATHGSDSAASAKREVKFFFPHVIMDAAPAVDPCYATLQPALLAALTALAKTKVGSTEKQCLTFIASHLLGNNSTKAKVLAPGALQLPHDAIDVERLF